MRRNCACNRKLGKRSKIRFVNKLGTSEITSQPTVIPKIDKMYCDSKYGLTPLGIDRHENAPVSGPDITINTPVQSDTGTPLQPSFHDSGIGSSRPSGPSGPSLVPPLSWTVHSASPSKDTHNRPSLPQIPKGRFGFTCPVCFRTQKLVITTGQWR